MQHVLPAIVRWLTENASFIITGVMSIIISVVLAPLWANRVRRSAAKRDAHLDELKRDVLRPMLTYLTEHVLPILEHHRANVGVYREFSHKPVAKAMENPIVISQRFSTYDVNEPPPDSFVDARGIPAPAGVFGGPLYNDASQHHFRDLLAMWEPVIAAFTRYNQECLRYVMQKN